MSVGVMKDYKLKLRNFHASYTGLVLELEQLKIETRLIDEKFANAMGECVTCVTHVITTVKHRKFHPPFNFHTPP